MALSGSRDFTVTRNQIVEDSLRIINAVPLGGTPTGDQITESVRVLNAMVKSWQSKGVFLWTEDRTDVTTVSGTASYNLTADYFDLREAYVRDDSDTDLPVKILSQEHYMRIPNKSTEGKPINLVFNRTLNPTVTLWPVPDDVYTLTLLAEKKLQDFDAPSNNPDFPTNWIDALTYGLAARLADRYQRPLDERMLLTQKAAALFITAKTKTNDERDEYVFVEPAY